MKRIVWLLIFVSAAAYIFVLSLAILDTKRTPRATNHPQVHKHHAKKKVSTHHHDLDPDRTPSPTIPAWARRKTYTREDAGPLRPAWTENSGQGPAGIVTFVGNDKYTDGAFVLGHSVRGCTGCVQRGKCRLGVLLSSKVSKATAERYQKSVFDDVIWVNRTFFRVNKNAPWGTTFDKFWLWNLVRYSVVVFFDADMLITHDASQFLSTNLPSNHYWIAAYGGQGYFATGTMVLRPDTAVLHDLVELYESVLHNKTDRWGFTGHNSRDGLVMRYFIAGRVIPLTTRKGTIHYSGALKPWYNWFGKGAEVKNLGKFLKSKPVFRDLEKKWWTAYEDVHTKYFVTSEEEERFKERWGGGVSPSTHVWMMRDSKYAGWGTCSRERAVQREVAPETMSYHCRSPSAG
eukprot:Sspe_Gene.38464::Locus_18532_Transcript_1_1_Confidence_1.000_Length_1300::g.38464::m.38464/K00750/GYG1, GYG2; glycogenin